MIQTFIWAVKDTLRYNYFNFRYRSPREVFYPYMLFVLLCTVPAVLLYIFQIEWAHWVAIFSAAVLLLPTTAIVVRRLHDTGNSGKSILLLAISAIFSWSIIDYEVHYTDYSEDYSDPFQTVEFNGIYILFGLVGVAVFIGLIWTLTRPSTDAFTPWDYDGENFYPPVRGARDKNR